MVYRARHSLLRRPVAIKLLRPGLAANPQAVRWFLAEAGHMQRLTHPHILPLLEVCEGTAGPYFVMPYLERGSLADLLRPSLPIGKRPGRKRSPPPARKARSSSSARPTR